MEKNKKHKKADDMISITKEIKKEYKKQGIKLSKNEINNLVIARMNRPDDEDIQARLDSAKIGEVHNDIRHIADKFFMRKTKRMIKLKSGKEIEQTIFTDYDITDFKEFEAI
jgi:hypothetical protein